MVDVDHPVVGGDEESRIVRQVLGEPGEDEVDALELLGPGRRVRTVHVAGLVEVAPVEVDEPGARCAHLGERLRTALLERLRGPEPAPAQRGPVESPPGELRLAEADDVDLDRFEALEERRIGHPGDGVDVEVPRELVEDGVLGRVEEPVADDAVGPGQTAGGQGGQGVRRRRREACGDRAAGGGEGTEEGCVPAVAAQQPLSESVDEDDDRGADLAVGAQRLGPAQRRAVEDVAGPKGERGGGHDVGEHRSRVVGGSEQGLEALGRGPRHQRRDRRRAWKTAWRRRSAKAAMRSTAA